MSRLLFAAARGARIQREIELLSGKFHWENVGIRWGLDDALRIHPDDAHLAYGPISTALRDFAAGYARRPNDDTYWRIARNHYTREVGAGFYTLHDRSLFLLILAESLADEGL